MNRDRIKSALEDDVFDWGLVHFGHTEYIRDYLMYFDGSTPTQRFALKYRFINCVIAESATSLSSDVWRRSLEDNLIGSLDDVVAPAGGWVWATCYGDMYPGATLLDSSVEADRWSAELGIPFYEALIEAPPIRLRVVFSDLIVEETTSGESSLTSD